MIGRDGRGRIIFVSNISGDKYRRAQCNRAFAEMLAESCRRDEEWPWRSQPNRQPRLHQKTADSAFLVAIFLATVALLLCCVR